MAPPTNHERNSSSSSKPKRKKSKRSKNDNDDTPKAFTRLMAYAATGKRPNGLDDPKTKPTSTSKKRKRSDPTSESNTVGTSSIVDTLPESEPSTTTTAPEPSKPLTLLPGEKLSDFSRRVDAAIPVSFKGLQRGEDNPKNRKLKKKKAAEEAEAAAAEEITEDNYDFDDNGDPLPNHLKPHNHNPHTKQQVNKTTKGKRKDRSPTPPSLIVPKEKLRDKTKGGVRGIQGLEVPKASGSLARREMLQEERKGVVERYRALMAARSGGM
ncbi:hypothetical protein TWF191_010691 [Orbilia oligospora]|uniref:Uncharacterized protein n=1 Tax=Orbilia oligospora TaxID=2813651 RepID=A0A7C8QHH6_ORBOL|nr:hypothetical protein TWF191_010691 [Orbilia oligospora]